MSRHLLSTVLPAMIAGGLVFASAFGHAQAPMPPMPPTPPAASPAPPLPPLPPRHHHRGSGMTVTVNNGRVQIDGLKGMVEGQLRTAIASVRAATQNMPPDVRAKIEAKLARVEAKLQKRLAKLDARNMDMDEMGEELGSIGEEIGEDMGQIGEEMGKWGEELGKKMEQQFGKNYGKNFGPQVHGTGPRGSYSDDDGEDDSGIPGVSLDDGDSDLDDAAADLGDLSLQPAQRQQIAQLRADTERQVSAAKTAMEQASATLERQLANPRTSDAEIARSIDAVTQSEAAIRKARILAWHHARTVLDDAQRAKVEGAAAKGKHR